MQRVTRSNQLTLCGFESDSLDFYSPKDGRHSAGRGTAYTHTGEKV